MIYYVSSDTLLTKQNQIYMTTTKRLSLRALVIGLLLIIPLVLTFTGSGVDGVGWHWTGFDFLFAFVVLFGSCVAYELISRRAKTTAYKFAVALTVLTCLSIIWTNGAVGIIGDEDNGMNLIYFGVILVGVLGAFISRFKPRGSMITTIVMAVAVALIPVGVFFVNRPIMYETPGVVGVFMINIALACAFGVAAALFRKAEIA
jgi:hypothetical protein